MSRKQIERDFKELYQEKNQKRIVDNYYKEKKKLKQLSTQYKNNNIHMTSSLSVNFPFSLS